MFGNNSLGGGDTAKTHKNLSDDFFETENILKLHSQGYFVYKFRPTHECGPTMPAVPVRLEGRDGQHINVVAGIDTMASNCIFPASFAEQIGLAYEEGQEVIIENSASHKTAGSLLPVKMHLLNPDYLSVINYSIGPTHVIFSKNQSVPLLGCNSFLEHFTLQFSAGDKMLVLQRS